VFNHAAEKCSPKDRLYLSHGSLRRPGPGQHGPCYDTEVNLEKVEEALKTFLPPPLPISPVPNDSSVEKA
jgi:hypothetical protein